jgi:D-alanyl-D-alanine carboxypeptidase/D-alanyl-D-alanine-endopeptidase (penicillin-binding protein 4)
MKRALRALALAAAMLLPVVAVPTAVAGSAVVELTASADPVTYGDAVTLTGLVRGDPTCSAGRAVALEWQPAGGAFAPVAQGVTGTDGAFSFEQSPPSTGRFRAVLAEAGACLETVSNESAVRVKVLVEASGPAGPSEAGSCVELVALVSPPKPGQTVDLQRRTSGVWSTVESVALNGDGQARAQACLGFADVGVARFRVRWPAQDALNVAGASPTIALEVTTAEWMLRIEDAIGGRAVSVSVAEEGTVLYRRADGTPRTPASNTKLLLAMASFDTFGVDHRIETRASAESFEDGVARGDLWLLGRGDPLVGRSSLGDLAQALVDVGLVRVTGDVMGSTAFFQRDWDAPGWNDVARDYVNRPTALTFEGNQNPSPEREAAEALLRQLERRGVRVGGGAGAGTPPGGLEELVSIESKPLRVLLTKVLRPSWNFGAEVLGKALGAEASGPPGTIGKGAAAIEAWIAAQGVAFTLFDNSGLSYDNRVTAAGLVELLDRVEEEPWGSALRRALPTGGQGTLEDRLHGVQVRAKTGTLTDISALSGWVFSERRDAWIEFSILSAGMSKPVASDLEDAIVRILERDAG